MNQSSIRIEPRPQSASQSSCDAGDAADDCGGTEAALAGAVDSLRDVEPLRDGGPLQDVDSLRGIVSEIEGFLDQWMQRFDKLLRRCGEPAERAEPAEPDAAMRQRIEKFDQEYRQWEEQRQRETEQLHEKAEQLTEAWLQLEAEQRAVLQAQASLKHRSRQPPTPSTARGDSPSNTAAAGSAAGAPPAAAETTISSSLSQQAAVQQFELLRHELGNHTPNARS